MQFKTANSELMQF